MMKKVNSNGTLRAVVMKLPIKKERLLNKRQKMMKVKLMRSNSKRRKKILVHGVVMRMLIREKKF